MKALKPFDAFLLATVLPVWALWFAFLVWAGMGGRAPWIPLDVSSSDPTQYPVVAFVSPFWTGRGDLAVGDRLIQVGDEDLRGVGQLGLHARIREAAARSFSVPITIERTGERLPRVIDVSYPWFRLYPRYAPFRATWATITGIFYGVAAIVVLVKGRGAPAARPLFLALLLCTVPFNFWPVGPRTQTFLLIGFSFVASVVSPPCYLQAARLLAGGERRWAWWPWLSALPILLIWWSIVFGAPLAMVQVWRAVAGYMLAFALSMLAVLTWGLRRADPQSRRRIKWVVYGFYAIYVPAVARSILQLRMGSEPTLAQLLTLDLLGLAPVLLPTCILIAVARFNLFDIDRIMSVTASYTILAILLLAGTLAIVPRIATAAAPFVGIDSSLAQLLLSLVLAAVVVPAHRRLHPQIERLFFKERHAIERGIQDLLHELAGCEAPEALFRLTGERLDAVLRPDSCVIYARTVDAFVPAFVRGHAVAAAFDIRAPLIAALECRTRPLVAERWAGGQDLAGLGPFDRAALETLDVAAILPIHRGPGLAGFVCLGSKRSGDVFTTTDLALLAGVAHAVSRELLRFDDAELVRQARVMQEALRRYVPAPVANQLAGAGGLAGEREVSVLFVDVRGYTTYAEGRRDDEIFTTTNRFTEAMSRVLRAHGGTVVEFSGDGLMAVFGAPEPLARKERAAVEAGRELLGAVGSLPVGGTDALSVGVGIASGPAYVGDVHAVDHHIWTAIGNTPNLAARLQALTRDLDAAMVIDATTRERAGYVSADFVLRERLTIRGRTEPADVYVLPLTLTGADVTR